MMEQSDEIVIPLSPKKSLLMIFGATVFVGLGIFFMVSPSTFVEQASPITVFIVGLVSVLFSGLGIIVMFRKLFSENAAMGLIINEQGIINNSDASWTGLVLWSDIQQIQVGNIEGNKFLLIILKNPQDYIAKVASPLARKGMEMNYRYVGTPISISSNTLQISFKKLYQLIMDRFEAHLKSVEGDKYVPIVRDYF